MDLLSLKILILLLGTEGTGQIMNTRRQMEERKPFFSGRPKKTFVKLRDINIGVLMSMSSPGNTTMCTEELNMDDFYTFPQVMAFSVKYANKKIPLPRNLSLGFVVLDDCNDDRVSAVQATSFIRKANCSDANEPAYDVIAVIGSETSSQSIAVANLLGPVHVPQFSVMSTSDDLTSKRQFPYFMRVVPPNRFQFQAIVQLIENFAWTYISVVYDDGSYGLDGFLRFKRLLIQNKICLAVARIVAANDFKTIDAINVAEDLIEESDRATVVVVITGQRTARTLIEATYHVKKNLKLIWIATVAWAHYTAQWTDLTHVLQDSLLVQFHPASLPDFDRYFSSLTPNTTNDPWFWDYWETLFKCDLRECDTNCQTPCNDSMNMKTVELQTDSSSAIYRGYIADIVVMISNATSRVIKKYKDCHNLSNENVHKCVTGPRLLRELKQTNQYGFSGWMELDDNGDRLGVFDIKQLRINAAGHLQGHTICSFNSKTGQVTHVSDVLWTMDLPLSPEKHPLSECSGECGEHSAKSPRNISCCWNCIRCQVNEYVSNNGKTCKPCPSLSWPDPSTNYNTCMAIPKDEVTYKTLIGQAQIIVAGLGLVVCLGVVLFFMRHPQFPMRSNSCLSLSLMTLLAIAMGYSAVILMTLTPSSTVCILIFLLFCTSFAMMHGSILVHQLVSFQNLHTAVPLALMSTPRIQLLVTFMLLSVQVAICVMTIQWQSEWNKIVQMSPTVPVVEHTCHLPVDGMLAFLLYNLILVVICALLALVGYSALDNQEDGFSEMRFLSMAVYTTFILGVCFVPAYLLAARQIFRMIILTLAILFSHTMGLCCLYLAKIYQLVYDHGITIGSKYSDLSLPMVIVETVVEMAKPSLISVSTRHTSSTPSSTPTVESSVFSDSVNETLITITSSADVTQKSSVTESE